MKIAQLACGLGVLLWFGACMKRAPEATAPSATAETANDATPAALEAAPVGPSPAPAPQGLGDESATRRSSGLDQEFATLEAAEQALNQAKADLDRLALAEPAPTLRSAPSDGATEKKDKSAAQAPRGGAAASSAVNARCDNACRAFASLSRAASAVCRLDGSSGSHCARAKQVLVDSERRVASCACPAAD